MFGKKRPLKPKSFVVSSSMYESYTFLLTPWLWALRAFSLMAFIFVGCARPHYETSSSNPASGGSTSQKVTNCPVRFSVSRHCVLWTWEKYPTTSQTGTLVFKIVRPNLLDETAVPVDVSLLPEVILWMPGMGHGSSPTTVTQVDVGSFRVSDVFFVMPGQWEMHFQLKEGNTVQDEAVVDLTF